MSRLLLNCDMGESFGSWTMGLDAEVMPFIDCANIACGFHAGDPGIMRKTVALALKHDVQIGAHPAYQDLAGFGRRSMAYTAAELQDLLHYQLGALDGICRAQGTRIGYVKPHGAMYNQAAKDPGLARAIARAVKDSGENIILMGLANSEFENAAKEMGVPFAAEAFADRGYMPDGSLVPRSQPGAIIHDVEEAAKRVVRMVTEGTVGAVDGTVINFRPQSICMHGDTPEAVDMAKTVRRELEAAGVKVTNLKEVVLG